MVIYVARFVHLPKIQNILFFTMFKKNLIKMLAFGIVEMGVWSVVVQWRMPRYKMKTTEVCSKRKYSTASLKGNSCSPSRRGSRPRLDLNFLPLDSDVEPVFYH